MDGVKVMVDEMTKEKNEMTNHLTNLLSQSTNREEELNGEKERDRDICDLISSTILSVSSSTILPSYRGDRKNEG